MPGNQDYLYRRIKYFDGLNALRFFAAYTVVMHHAETIRQKYHLPNFENIGLFRNGETAVNFFFVLSGFLITYLLLKEENITGDISVKQFYLKRIFRILPLYFLLVAFGTIILPFVLHILNVGYIMPYTFGEVWYYFVFMFPALVTFHYGTHILQALWSIGVEEIFYLMWAPVVKFFRKRILIILFSVIAGKILLAVLFTFYVDNKVIKFLIDIYRFEAMAVGGLGAYWIFHLKKNVGSLRLFQKPIQIVLYLSFSVYFLFQNSLDLPIYNQIFLTPILSDMILNIIFVYLIISVPLNEKAVFSLKNKFWNKLGDISYAVYMYHLVVIFFVILVLQKTLANFGIVAGSIIFYSIITFLTVSVSLLSHKYFETPFLNMKKTLDKRYRTSPKLAEEKT